MFKKKTSVYLNEYLLENITEDSRFPKYLSPYIVKAPIFVSEDVTLEIESGVTFEFRKRNKRLNMI